MRGEIVPPKYWQLGRDLLERQAQGSWGSGVIDQVSADLRAAFPEMKGFSTSNLKYMRAFAEAWPDFRDRQQPVGELPWGHNVVLLTKLKQQDQRIAYAQAALSHGWSRNVLVHHKAGKFKPEHTGQLGFYLTAVDAQVKAEQDGPTIGLLLCKSKNRVVAEYALRDTNRPIGVAEYQLVEALPKELETSLPSIEQLERELGEVDG